MKLIKSLILISVILALCFTTSVYAQAELTVKDIVEAMQANTVLTAQSLKVRYTIRHISVKTGDVWRTSEYFWTSEGKKLFRERTIHESGKPEYKGIEAFDGEFSRTYGFVNNTGRIMANPSGIILGEDPRRLYASIRSHSLTDLLADAEGNTVRLLPQKEVIGGHSCYVIEGDFPEPYKRHFKVCIDAQYDFLPVRIEEISPDWRDIKQVTEFQKLPGNLWFPRQLCRTVFRRKQPEDQDLTKFAIEEYTFHDPEVGQDIDDQMFVLKYPVGAGIWDEILQTGYYVGEPSGQKAADDIIERATTKYEEIIGEPVTQPAQQGKIEKAGKTQSQGPEGPQGTGVIPPVPTEEGHFPPYLGLIAIALALLAILIFLVLQRRKRRGITG